MRQKFAAVQRGRPTRRVEPHTLKGRLDDHSVEWRPDPRPKCALRHCQRRRTSSDSVVLPPRGTIAIHAFAVDRRRCSWCQASARPDCTSARQDSRRAPRLASLRPRPRRAPNFSGHRALRRHWPPRSAALQSRTDLRNAATTGCQAVTAASTNKQHFHHHRIRRGTLPHRSTTSGGPNASASEQRQHDRPATVQLLRSDREAERMAIGRVASGHSVGDHRALALR